MKFLVQILATAAGVAAYPAPPGSWTATISTLPGALTKLPAELEGATVQANGGSFWVGKSPSSSCPQQDIGDYCNKFAGNATVFVGANSVTSVDSVYLDVGAPGQQQVYITWDNALAYNSPDSTCSPEGIITASFGRDKPGTSDETPFLFSSAGDFEACPSAGDEGVYGLWVHTDNSGREGCTVIRISTAPANGASAWQY
ncbi:hypothetical protein BJ166DRAFT_238927 [Pestalotiopsis sp. NC0098]|nr:hypothetical protein BJ166DRAFT_238927 [Pestalotiopsis sp. NC0098]